MKYSISTADEAIMKLILKISELKNRFKMPIMKSDIFLY